MCFTGVWDKNKGLAMGVIWGLLSHLHWKMFCEDNRFQAAMSQHLLENSSQISLIIMSSNLRCQHPVSVLFYLVHFMTKDFVNKFLNWSSM